MDPTPTPRQYAILLVGPTGSGKSSFVKSLTKEYVEIMHGLKPSTTECKAYTVEQKLYAGLVTFTIIDTPGFDGSPDADLNTVHKIAKMLHQMGSQFVICGVIYFHRITDRRFAGAARASLAISKSICGRDFFPFVAAMTTMWDTIDQKRHAEYESLNRQLEKLGGHLRLSDSGPTIFKRLRNDEWSCREVLEHFARLALTEKPPQLLLVKESREFGLSKKGVRKTTAGKEIMEKVSAGSSCTIL
ncbi:Nucleolar GTP-binding protein 1 [Madurella mycetomatis]|uniref:Nucleolar GTP-binding protein 1 n=1 Tax=Madurella mycetomatis TaxID=100816 RepID=A0A175VR89_9PEZI|nr:Nucleolar GTP-binding protein 1 [Madurella mycetomatis]